LAKLGAQVVIVNRSKVNGKKIERRIISRGCKTLHITVDISKFEDINMIIDETIKRFGKIDILINSAGINIRKRIEKFTEKDWNEIMNTNLKGVFFCCQKIGEKMAKRNYGKIVNIGSVAGEQVVSLRSIYNGSKAALHTISKSMAIEWAKYNVNVNVVAPGMIITSLTEKLLEGNK